MNITKKILAIALTVFALPSTISAATVNVGTAEDLLDAVKVSGDEVVLTKNIEADVVIEEGVSLTLDLNGYTLSNVKNHTIVNNGTLTIKDSSEKTGTVDSIVHAKAALDNNGTAVLNGGIFTRSLETGTSPHEGGTNTHYTIRNTKGEMTINEGVTVKQNGKFSSLVINSVSPYVGAKMTINDGTFDGGLTTIKNDENGTLTINNGEFKNAGQNVITNWHIATINNGTFTGSKVVFINGSCSKISEGLLTVNDGTYTAGIIFDQFNGYGANTTLNINGGTYNASESLFTTEEFPNLTIKGGVFEPEKETTTIETKVEAITEVVESVKTLVEEKFPEESTLVGYFDVEAFIKEGNAEYDITKLDDKIKVEIELPTTIEKVKEGYSRKYYVVREHEGVAELIDATLNGDKIEFETDRFSTYALTYVDTKDKVELPKEDDKVVDDLTKEDNEVNPDTGINYGLYITILVAGLATVVTTLKLRKN